MKKTTTLQNKLKAYAAVAGAVTAASAANAQIVYTDIIPDTTVNTINGDYQLDLNNDGTVDFAISYQQIPITFGTTGGGTVQYTYDLIVAAGNNPSTNQIDTSLAQSTGNPGFPQTASHPATTPIGPTNLWFAGYGTGYTHFLAGASTMDPTTYNWGDWNGAVDKYVAMKFDILGQTHYGWARLDVAQNANSFTIKDYAYDATPNTIIIAGDMTTGVSTQLLNGVKVFAFDNKVNVNLGEITNATVTITDMTGRIINNTTIPAGNQQINLAGQSAGMYLVAVTTATGTSTTKVMIQ
ncbi:hypothetical protein BH11BAC7_BH11BAC7_27520 [soil metagenome]